MRRKRFLWAIAVVAGGVLLYKEVASDRLESAMNGATACLAQRDAPCVARSIAQGRAWALEDEPRLDIAAAGLDVLTGHDDEAALATTRERALPELEAQARGELLLVEGDLEEARGQYKQSRDSWLAARPLVDDEILILLRLSRADVEDEARAAPALRTTARSSHHPPYGTP